MGSDICFMRTAREHAGKPIYHGHTQLGTPCQVLWAPGVGWVLVQLTQVHRCSAHEVSRVPLGSTNSLADVGDAKVLSLDAVSAPSAQTAAVCSDSPFGQKR